MCMSEHKLFIGVHVRVHKKRRASFNIKLHVATTFYSKVDLSLSFSLLARDMLFRLLTHLLPCFV